MIRALACLPLLVASTARAEDGPLAIPGDEPPPPAAPAPAPQLGAVYRYDPYWDGVAYRATNTARVGMVMSVAGPPMIVGGALVFAVGLAANDGSTALSGSR